MATYLITILAELTGDAFPSSISFLESLFIVLLTLARTSRRFRTATVRPTSWLVLLLQLFTEPNKICFCHILWSWFFPGLLVPGNLAWKLSNKADLNPLTPFLLCYSSNRKFLSWTLNCGLGTWAIPLTYRKLDWK